MSRCDKASLNVFVHRNGNHMFTKTLRYLPSRYTKMAGGCSRAWKILEQERRVAVGYTGSIDHQKKGNN
jgi:hypothetical protein